MRSPLSPALLVVLFGLAGCSTSATVDALDISPETTSSVARPAAPIPEGDGSEVAEGDGAGIAALAEPDQVTAEAAATVALVTPERPMRATGRHKVVKAAFRDAHPINFGPRKPQHHAVHGVDVSRWQGNIDWEKLRSQGANFAYIKATDGTDHLDEKFRKNWNAAAKAGLKRGAYHFFYWCSFASAQADWFIRNVPKERGALPPVLDVEWNHHSKCRKRPSPAFVREKMQVFLDRLEKHYGQRPVIYATPDFYERNLKGYFKDYPFWLRAVAEHPSKVYPGREWVFWQYSGSGLSHGVSGRIDLNVFHGDPGEWQRWLERTAG
ncbi:glycoside hydrolase family 25 protein [Nitratireductor mangrovi]|uniref:Glycoside hydrolase family 25 protein n=1 Tax=Nitratireductor mangrovi TaxID=2599600 RepID=A0A5B8KVR6_9HYPH|nr:GH25 family lysozyme [Nitratireductor mangrovi]QDY99650.1 glycoside hydrolase family 25 protein [Nitratireductor mangrovi]